MCLFERRLNFRPVTRFQAYPDDERLGYAGEPVGLEKSNDAFCRFIPLQCFSLEAALKKEELSLPKADRERTHSR
jgi:hypothetical protein